MTEPIDGPVVYPQWTSANAGDEVVQGSRGLVRRMGSIIRPWSTTGTAFTYDSGSGIRTVDVTPPVALNSLSLTPDRSLVRIGTAEHFGLSLIRPVELAKVGDEVRDLDAATTLPVGTLLGTGNIPGFVVVGDGSGPRTLYDLRTGQPVKDLLDFVTILYLAPRTTALAADAPEAGADTPEPEDQGS